MADAIIPVFKLWQAAVHPGLNQQLQGNQFVEDEFCLPYREVVALRVVGVVCFTVISLAQRGWSWTGTLMGTSGVAICSYVFEHIRAERKVRQMALDVFAQGGVQPYGVVTYLARDFEAFKQIVKNRANLNHLCQDITGQLRPFYNVLVQCSLQISKKDESWFKIFKDFISSVQLNNREWISLALYHSRCLLYALSQNLVQPGTWTAADQLQLWSWVQDASLMKALVDNGCDINIKDLQGKTPTVAKLEAMLDEYALCQFFSLGATPPSLEDEIDLVGIVNDENPKEGVRYKFLKSRVKYINRPKILAILEQARQGGIPDPLPEQKAHFFMRGPVVNIVFPEKQFHIAQSILNWRFRALAFTIWIVAAKSLIFFIGSLTTVQGSFVIALALGIAYTRYLFEWYRAKRFLDEGALKAFQKVFPPSAVFHHVMSDVTLWKQIKKENLNKMDDKGYTLIDYLNKKNYFSKAYFQQIASSGIDLTALFYVVSEQGRSDFARVLLDEKNVQVENNHRLWECVHGYDMAQFLIKRGFDVNVKDEKGLTLLEKKLIQGNPIYSDVDFLFSIGCKMDLATVPNFEQLAPEIKQLILK